MATGISPVAISPVALPCEWRNMELRTKRSFILDKDSNEWLSLSETNIREMHNAELVLNSVLLNNMLQDSKRWKRYIPGTNNILYVPPVLHRPLIELKITNEDKL